MKLCDDTCSKEQIELWSKQRLERGFSDYDVYDIHLWFLRIMPEMIEELYKVYEGYPTKLEKEYYRKFSIDPRTLTKEQVDARDEYCSKRWTEILLEMKQAFIDADVDGGQFKNKYQDEYDKLLGPYIEKYGCNGERLKGNIKKEYIKDENGNVVETYYSVIKEYHFEDMSEEHRRIKELFDKEERRLYKYRLKSKKKALKIFVKYFDDLWW